MNVNGHELETKYLFYIEQLKKAKHDPRLLDFIWVRRYRRQLTERLKQLEKDFENENISDKAFVIWSKMINDVL